MNSGAMRGRAGTILWMCCLQFFVAEQVAAHAWKVPYSFALNYVSDLGAMHCEVLACSPLHAMMNASFVLQGLLIMGGTVLVRRLFSPRPAYTWALGLMALSGLGVLVVGLAPEDVWDSVHVAGATAHFAGGGLGMLSIGVLLLKDARRSPAGGWLSVVMGAAVLAATALLGFRHDPVWTSFGLDIGVVERVAAYGIPLWVIGMGAGLLKWRIPNF